MGNKAIILLILFVISVTTLVAAIATQLLIYTISTIIGHVALVFFGYFYAKDFNDKRLERIRRDLMGL